MKDKKWLIILPIALFLFIGIAVASSQNTKTNIDSNIIKNILANEVVENITEKEILPIEKLSFSETDIEIDIKETKDILVNILPSNADVTEMKFNSSNAQIANFSKDILKSTGSTLYGKLQPVAEGQCEIFVESNNVKSDIIKVTVIDKERIENERKAQEEQAQKEAQEKAEREAQEQAEREAREKQAQKEAEEKAKQEAQEKAQKQSQSQKSNASSSQSSTNNSRTVYITPTGKRYHLSPTCGGKNSSATTLSHALSIGLTPCKKCAQ